MLGSNMVSAEFKNHFTVHLFSLRSKHKSYTNNAIHQYQYKGPPLIKDDGDTGIGPPKKILIIFSLSVAFDQSSVFPFILIIHTHLTIYSRFDGISHGQGWVRIILGTKFQQSKI